MTIPLSERDWKVFRKLHAVALDRFSERILAETSAILTAPGGAHERYIAVYKQIHMRDRQIGEAFDDPRRSNALMKLAVICTYNLLTEEELAQLSQESQQVLAGYAGG